MNLRPLRPERGTTVRCRAIEHVRWRSEHDSGASGSSSAVRWAWVCSFLFPGFVSASEATDLAPHDGCERESSPGRAYGHRLWRQGLDLRRSDMTFTGNRVANGRQTRPHINGMICSQRRRVFGSVDRLRQPPSRVSGRCGTLLIGQRRRVNPLYQFPPPMHRTLLQPTRSEAHSLE